MGRLAADAPCTHIHTRTHTLEGGRSRAERRQAAGGPLGPHTLGSWWERKMVREEGRGDKAPGWDVVGRRRRRGSWFLSVKG